MVNKVNALLLIAAANPEGFTVSAKTLAPIVSGYAVAVAETQNSFGNEGLARVIDFVGKNGVDAFGGWLDHETGLYYWDAVLIAKDIESARELALLNKQIAFYDLNNQETIWLNK